MATRHDITLLLEQARERAFALRRPVLLSASRPIDQIAPLDALENATRACQHHPELARHVGRTRVYWARPSEGFALAGFGEAVSIETAGRERFQSAEWEWKSILENAVIDDGGKSDATTGPILMGGFAYDPNGPKTEKWRGFPGARLVVPRALVVSEKSRHWLTVNVVVGSGDDIDAQKKATRTVESALLDVPEFSPDDVAVELDPPAIEFREPESAAQWQSTVALAVDLIRKGELHKVVLAREVDATTAPAVDVFALLRELASAQPSSFNFGFWHGSRAFVGASPERLVRLDDQDVQTSSLAGTIRRGATSGDDASNARELAASAKDRAEHSAVREEIIRALAESCDEIDAPPKPALLTLPNMHHLHTPIRARLRSDASLLSLAGRLHPTPAVGGAPRDAALRFISDHEGMDRGWYAAPVGWVGRNHGEFAVALRSALIDGSTATLFAGCGIVADSDPALEYAESSLKLQAMKSAIENSFRSGAVLDASESMQLVPDQDRPA